jgi:hypothetical protein
VNVNKKRRNEMKMTPVQAIREFFQKDGGREVRLDELKHLSSEERAELAKLSAVELGVELEIPVKK